MVLVYSRVYLEGIRNQDDMNSISAKLAEDVLGLEVFKGVHLQAELRIEHIHDTNPPDWLMLVATCPRNLVEQIQSFFSQVAGEKDLKSPWVEEIDEEEARSVMRLKNSPREEPNWEFGNWDDRKQDLRRRKFKSRKKRSR